MQIKRIVIATILGLIFGVISWLWCATMGAVPLAGIVSIVLGGGLMGFGIGISHWQISWWWHGMFMGLIYRIGFAFIPLWVGRPAIEILYLIVSGIVFGFLIELITVVFFKAKVPKLQLSA
jgi:hypothetical protein